MRIAILNNYFAPVGGAEKIAYDTYKILRSNNHDVYYIATDQKPYFEDNNPNIKYLIPNKYNLKGYLLHPIRYYYDKNAEKQLTLFLEGSNPDIVHLHNILAFSPSILKCLKDIPTVLTVHQADIVCPASTMMLNNKVYCKQQYCKKYNVLPCLFHNCSKNNIEASFRRSLLIYLYRKNLEYIDKFITPSNALKSLILNSDLNINSHQIITINNFLSSTELNLIPKYTNEGYFLYIGRLSKEKRVITLLEAMKDLPREIKLKIAGTGTEENNLKLYAKENNLENVEFLGFTNREEVTELYQNCIATILPCNWFEIFGMTNIESFINGKPVIASNIGGIPEIVEHDITGQLFEPGNVEQLKECILKYWNNPDLVVEHGKNGYQKAITQYTEEIYYKELMKVYEEAINESKK